MRKEKLGQAMGNSICFGLLEGDDVVGFGRVVTDHATFAYITDVTVDSAKRGEGLGRWMVECIISHPSLQGLRRISLLTRDAAEFYQRLGFVEGSGALEYLEIVPGRMSAQNQRA